MNIMKTPIAAVITAGFLIFAISHIGLTAAKAEDLSITEQAQALVDGCPRKGGRVISRKIFCMDKKGFLLLAYNDFNRSPELGEKKPERALDRLRIHALRFDESYTNLRIEALGLLGLADDDELVVATKEAMKWAAPYKSKSAEELYELSQGEFEDPAVGVHFKKRVQRELLAIAKARGFVVPETEVEVEVEKEAAVAAETETETETETGATSATATESQSRRIAVEPRNSTQETLAGRAPSDRAAAAYHLDGFIAAHDLAAEADANRLRAINADREALGLETWTEWSFAQQAIEIAAGFWEQHRAAPDGSGAKNATSAMNFLRRIDRGIYDEVQAPLEFLFAQDRFEMTFEGSMAEVQEKRARTGSMAGKGSLSFVASRDLLNAVERYLLDLSKLNDDEIKLAEYRNSGNASMTRRFERRVASRLEGVDQKRLAMEGALAEADSNSKE